MFFGIIIGIVIMCAVAYMALDKKSDFQTRLVSLGALALMILTLIICIIAVLTHHSEIVDESVVYVGIPEKTEEKEEGNNLLAIIFSILFLIILFLIVAFLAMREHKRNKAK